MKHIRFKFKDDILIVSAPNVSTLSDDDVLKLLKKDLPRILTIKEANKKEDTFTYLNNKKYNIKMIDEYYENVIIEEDSIIVNKKHYKKQINDLFARYLEEKVEKYLIILRDYFIDIPPIKYKNLKSCFGSYCLKNNVITMNNQLAKYPEEFIYLTLAHELCHTRYFNHSKSFYELLQIFVPDCKKKQLLLRKIKYNDIY